MLTPLAARKLASAALAARLQHGEHCVSLALQSWRRPLPFGMGVRQALAGYLAVGERWHGQACGCKRRACNKPHASRSQALSTCMPHFAAIICLI